VVGQCKRTKKENISIIELHPKELYGALFWVNLKIDLAFHLMSISYFPETEIQRDFFISKSCI
jgi:hypothetical protein